MLQLIAFLNTTSPSFLKILRMIQILLLQQTHYDLKSFFS